LGIGYSVKAKFLVAGVVVVVLLAAGAAGLLYVQQRHGSSPAPAAVPAPAPPAATPLAPAAPAVPPPPAAAPTECLLPGPPPVPPDGSTASDADMKLGHDAIQHFVLQLEAFQACRNAMIDHAPAGTTEEQKKIWVEEGNAAVDEAHALADAFARQLKIFHAPKK
jgi:hypothetical protein